jgi:hypothetical protein
MGDTIAAELEGIDLGDKRLNRRTVAILDALAADPQATVNGAHAAWGDTLAAYRFFNNPRVSPEDILRPHGDATRRRIRDHPVVLIVQDTTEIDLSRHAPRDARCLDGEHRRGFYDHIHLAVTPDGLCLGVVGSDQFDRDPASLGQGRARKALPIAQKESVRWLNGYRLACELQADTDGVRIVSVADAEADIYEIFVDVSQQASPADFLIRARENRCTPDRDPASEGRVFHKVRDTLARAPVRVRRTVALPQTPKRHARQAELEIRAATITIKPPDTRPGLPPVTLQFVHVREVNGPGDQTEVEWLLMTSLSIETPEDILRVVDYYMARWTVEVYFRTLKTGCKVEEIQLETVARVKNCLALYKIIAWRIVYLTHRNRTAPDIPCTRLFADHEWQPVWRVTTAGPLPPEPPTLGAFIRRLATLGGYNNRAGDPPPGPQVLWTATRRMLDFAIAWLTFGPKE